MINHNLLYIDSLNDSIYNCRIIIMSKGNSWDVNIFPQKPIWHKTTFPQMNFRIEMEYNPGIVHRVLFIPATLISSHVYIILPCWPNYQDHSCTGSTVESILLDHGDYSGGMGGIYQVQVPQSTNQLLESVVWFHSRTSRIIIFKVIFEN